MNPSASSNGIAELPVDFDVLSWRYECLIAAGYPVETAIEIAERGEVDLHRACELLKQGASQDEALRILL